MQVPPRDTNTAVKPIYRRTAIIEVTAPESWLTDDGMTDMPAGYAYFERQFQRYLETLPNRGEVMVTFKGWHSEPEVMR